MKTRPSDYLDRSTILCQLAEEAAELAQAALKERRTITRDDPTPVSYNTAHAALIEEVADVYCCLGELLNLCDWESVATIRRDKETRWMQRLFKGGTEHRKFMRQIFISMDITAPLYWWKEFDTYKVGTVANSCSTMHKIQAKEFTLDDFSHEKLNPWNLEMLQMVVDRLEANRKIFLGMHDKWSWFQMIQLLPSSYNQKRTITMTYENAAAMIHQREHHKLDEWIQFVEILKGLPYMKEIMGAAKD